MIKVLIVDDEPLAQDVLETYIEQIPDIELAGKCSNAIEASSCLNENTVDVILLDIQMPQLTGIEFVKSLNNPPLIVFTTAYPNYAVDGFELDAVDYLLKPISMERFLKALNKVRGQLQTSSGDKQHDHDDDFFFVKADKKLVKVKYADILYIEGLKDYVIIRMEEGRVITLQTMKSLEEKLPSNKFMRIHRSYIVALDKIQALVGNMVEIMEKGQTKHLPVGKNYRDELLELINERKL
jgi:DNA-binding LytR/AlgR family response regulator